MTALRDATRGHRSLLAGGEILHRDVSENNIIIADLEHADGFVGMLVDLDLAKLPYSEPSSARHQTGTMEFMAIQVLRRATPTYRHDLESLFYVLLWKCARRSWELGYDRPDDPRPGTSVLRDWYIGTFEEIARLKRGCMHADGFEELLAEFPQAFNPVKPLCRQIRGILFPLLKGGELDIGTPSGPPEKLYDAIIEAFDKAISQIS